MRKVKRAFRSSCHSTPMKRTMLHAGWLTKSPPERKAWGIIKPQWRRRYFVLSSKNASNTLPGSCPAELEYFENERQVKRKGRINLDNCEKVVIHMESEYYKHVLLIKTTDRGTNRTYYLAADNEMDMERWVEQLKGVLNLHDEGHVVFQPSSRSNNVQPPTSPQDLQRNQSSLTQSFESAMSPSSGVSSLFGSPLPNEDYLPIDQCLSGPPILTPRQMAPTSVRIVNIKSPPPSSPGSLSLSHDNDKYYNLTGDNQMTNDDVYNYPKPYPRDSEIYKVPTASHDNNFHRDRDSDVYKIPPSRNGGSSGHDFAYDQRSSSREGSRDSNYDYPPPRVSAASDRDSNYDYPPGAVPVQDDDCVRPIWECESRTLSDLPGDTYDIVPSLSQLQNGASFSSLPPAPRPPAGLDGVYDIPGRSGSQMAPPKGHRMPTNVHRYINAAPTPVRSQGRDSEAADESLYLPMGSGEVPDDVYLPMNQMEKVYATRTSNPAKRSVSGLPPPPPVPVTFGGRSSGGDGAQKVPMTLPRSMERTSDQPDHFGGLHQHHSLIRGTPRTRSFKRDVPPPSSTNDISLPMKKSGNEDSSSDDDDDDESVGSSPKQEYMNLGSDMESPPVLSPPKPAGVQYLDLDLDGTSPMVTSTTSSSDTQSKIEYNEIDMEKTQALFDAKLMLEKERKGSEKSDL